MYEKVFEQAESFLKPFNEIIALNMEAFEKMREQQTELYNELMADGIEHAKDLSKPSLSLDLAEIFSTQQSYIEGVKDKLTANAYNSYDYWADVQGKSGELWQSALDNTSNEMASAASAPAAVTPKKKTTAKKATKKSAAKVEQAVESVETAAESTGSE